MAGVTSGKCAFLFWNYEAFRNDFQFLQNIWNSAVACDYLYG